MKKKKVDFNLDIAKFTPRQMEAIDHLDSGMIKFLLYGGALGGGKSYLLRWYGIRRLMKLYQEYGVSAAAMLACEDYPSLQDRQIVKIAKEVPPWLGRLYDSHKFYGRCLILSDKWGGGALCFRNLDDPSKYQSAEFALIMVDELTKNQYDVFTHLRSRLRWSGVPDIECQFVAGTNPGGPGHGWVKQLWMDKLFGDEWIHPIDYRSLFAYVPSKAEDNPHLSPDYWAILGTLPENLRAAFRDGDWDVFVGQAFPQFSRVVHVIAPRAIPEYAQTFMTFDWGFGKPFSVGWWWVDSEGRIYRCSEWYGCSGTPDSGLRLEDSVIAKGIQERESELRFTLKNPMLRLAGPDCFAKKPDYKGGGQGKSTAEVFAEHGIFLIPGDVRREVKIRQFRERLRILPDAPPMMLIYDTCKDFIRTIPNLVMDKNRIEDVDTDGEDHCLHGDTKIFTDRGLVAIKDAVGTKGYVLTPDGYRKYGRCWMTRQNAGVVNVVFEDGRSVKCTKDHKFLNNKSVWIEAKDLYNEACHVMIKENMTEAALCESLSFQAPSRSLTGSPIGDADCISKEKGNGFIGQYGSGIMGASQRVAISITAMATEITTKLKTLQYWLVSSIAQIIPGWPTTTTGLRLNVLGHQGGTEVRKEKAGTKTNTQSIARVPCHAERPSYVSIAVKSIKQSHGKSAVPGIAQINGAGKEVSVRNYGHALSAAKNFMRLFLQKLAHVLKSAGPKQLGKSARVISVENAGTADVYCLSLPHPHAFIIDGGLISHNCYDEACHICMARPMGITPKYEPKTDPERIVAYVTGKTKVMPWEKQDQKANRYIQFDEVA